jgi:hypothetical protein
MLMFLQWPKRCRQSPWTPSERAFIARTHSPTCTDSDRECGSYRPFPDLDHRQIGEGSVPSCLQNTLSLFSNTECRLAAPSTTLFVAMHPSAVMITPSHTLAEGQLLIRHLESGPKWKKSRGTDCRRLCLTVVLIATTDGRPP